MSYGLQVYDSSGNIFLDISNRISRLIGTYTVTFPAGTVTTYAGYNQWPYTWTSTQTILSTDYAELSGMTAASNQWAVASLSPNMFVTLVDVAGAGRIIARSNRNTNPRVSSSGSLVVFRF